MPSTGGARNRCGQYKVPNVSPNRLSPWIQWRRRLVRWEFFPQNFLGFARLACVLTLFRQIKVDSSVQVDRRSTLPNCNTTVMGTDAALHPLPPERGFLPLLFSILEH